MDPLTDQLYFMTYGHIAITTPFGHKYLINADTTASGYPNQVIETIIANQVLPYYGNTHSNAYGGRLMSHYIELSNQMIKKSVKAKTSDRLIFTGNGCSGAINHLIHCLNLKNSPQKKVVVFVSRAEHHSNLLPWKHLPVDLIYIPLLPNGLINIKVLEKELQKYQQYDLRICSFIATSNVTGVHQKVHLISQLVHRYRGYIFWDYAASAPYVPIDMHRNDANGQYFDAIFVSIHKFFGGPGTPGLLVANQSLFQNQIPYCPAGGTVRFVCSSFQIYNSNIETKETGGTPNIIGCIRAGLAFDLKNKYQPFILKRDRLLVRVAQRYLSKIPNLTLLNPTANNNRLPIFIFTIDQLHYNLIVVLLSDLFGVQTRGGISCCSLLAQQILKIDKNQERKICDQIINDRGVPDNYGWVRFTLHYSMPDCIVKYILKTIRFVAKYGILFKNLYQYYPKKNNWAYCPHGCLWNDFSNIKLSLDSISKKPTRIYLNDKQLQSQLDQAYNVLSIFKK